jgi:hypothetical protein
MEVCMNTLTNATSTAVDAFLKEIQATPTRSGGRLIFAVDATASREWSWDTACKLQVEMFRAAAAIGGLEIQLVYYRGISECRASKWVGEPGLLARMMEKVMCRAGETQIKQVLEHAQRESERGKVSALVFVGDACEESRDELAPAAAALGHVGVPAFMFQEGDASGVKRVFCEIADLTHGVYGSFNAGAADQLRELLRAVAVFAAGGVEALEDSGADRKLIAQLKRGS